jgi:hypothetical protein
MADSTQLLEQLLMGWTVGGMPAVVVMMVMMVRSTTTTTTAVSVCLQGGWGTIDNDYHWDWEKPSLQG